MGAAAAAADVAGAATYIDCDEDSEDPADDEYDIMLEWHRGIDGISKII